MYQTDISIKCVISCSHDVYDLTYVCRWRDDGEVTTNKAGKPVTTVQDNVSRFKCETTGSMTAFLVRKKHEFQAQIRYVTES